MPQPGCIEQWNDEKGCGFVRLLESQAGAAVTLAGGWGLGRWPAVVPVVHAAMSLVAVLACRHDKVAAERSRWRTPGNTLHMLDLLGGWPGGLLAQQAFSFPTSFPQVH